MDLSLSLRNFSEAVPFSISDKGSMQTLSRSRNIYRHQIDSAWFLQYHLKNIRTRDDNFIPKNPKTNTTRTEMETTIILFF